MVTGLTSKGAATRRRIVTASAELVREQGVEHVSLDDIRAATATSKSQLFHYFPLGRSDLMLAVAQHEAQQVLDDQQPFLDELGPAGSWAAWRDAVIAKYEKQGSHCPLNALTRQLSPSNPGVAPLVAQLLADWHARIAAGISRSRETGKGRPQDDDAALDPAQAAAVILAAIQGGVVLLQATADSSFLRTALDTALQAV